ncbi:FAD/NAD-binding domain-containing protein [Laetiporus sulphureus 93-53]|uniref:FAD/NAD-binding domain-containing protein n=1 Tax=Laetiporus sulphureus 93-53 TaxID=1314785 RepID=A0A165EVP3_9APHY|nr:FAD/NAD-binding domain-containing protein [Laetiporus sulphureus 93-53]KZT07862.1 FAD/NAD-binding domain-containing protein [Laetiporus sulphureus 93-53]
MSNGLKNEPATNGLLNGVDDSFQLGDFAIDEYRPIKVVVIGAGYSGIIAGIRFPQRIPNVELTIYEKNAGIGGTWYTNKYPGVACDTPSHSYQLTFEPKTDWSSFYPPGPEILSYLESVVDKYKLMRYIKLQHRVVEARYDEPTGKWHLRVRRPRSANPAEEYEEFTHSADFLLTGIGVLSRWDWPDIDGLHTFEGKLLHSADFDVGNRTWQEATEEWKWKDKKVGVIGVGSSAIQIVAALQPRVGKLVQFVRGKTWISPPFASAQYAELVNRDQSVENYTFTEEAKESFKDQVFYKHFRHELESLIHSYHGLTLRDSVQQAAGREAFTEHMRKKLSIKPWIMDHLLPDWSVACRRLTPAPGYLEALCEENVDFVPKEIRRVTPRGIETVDGQHTDLDAVICATGFDVSFQLDFPIIGRDGVSVQEKWTPHPSTYLSLCTDGFPNWFMSIGPNGALGVGSLLIMIERQIEYAVMAAKKMQRERLKSIEVKSEAVRDFDEYLETVFSDNCRSWYKMGKVDGRNVAIWPGSSLHSVRALEHPRWEDYKYEYTDGVRNRMYWLGDGQTYNEKTMTGDRAWYLNDDEVDIPPGESYSENLLDSLPKPPLSTSRLVSQGTVDYNAMVSFYEVFVSETEG